MARIERDCFGGAVDDPTTQDAGGDAVLDLWGGSGSGAPSSAASSSAVQSSSAKENSQSAYLLVYERVGAPPVRAIPIGHVADGSGLTLKIDGAVIPLPDSLGWEHG